MDILLKIIVIAILSCIIMVTFKKHTPELALILAITAVLVIISLTFDWFNTLKRFIDDLIRMAGLSPEIIGPVVKTVAIAILAKITADICRDANENAVASNVEIAACAAAITVSLPLFMSVLNLISTL